MAAQGAAKSTTIGGVMSQYMLLVYEEEVDPAEQAERERELPMLVELHASLREAGARGIKRILQACPNRPPSCDVLSRPPIPAATSTRRTPCPISLQ
jgi:hypothetical protein